MNITIVALGSRGDIQPFAALGRALSEAGHKVSMCSHILFADLIKENGMDFVAVVPEDPKALLNTWSGKMFSSGKPLLSFIGGYFFFRSMGGMLEDMLENCSETIEGTDLLINSTTSPCHMFAEKFAKPCITASLWPAVENSDYPHPALSFDLGRFNRYSYKLIDALTYIVYRKPIKRWRKANNLEKMSLKKGIYSFVNSKAYPWIFAFSEHILKRPAIWKDNNFISGYWFLDSHDKTLSPELEDFISSGEKPICIGFGSMIFEDTDSLIKVIKESLELTGQRAVIISGWSEYNNISDRENIYVCNYAPHDILFPKVAAVIHHGGCGTTAAALRAGVPSIIVPFLADQYFWSAKLYNMQLGPKAVNKKKLDKESLSYAIQTALSDSTIQNNLNDISKKIKEENGLKKAVEFIESFMEDINAGR